MLYFVPQFILSVSEGVSRFPVYDKHINCYVIHDSSMVQGRLTFEIKHGPQNLGDMPISCNVHFCILKLVTGIRMLLSTISWRNKPQRIFQQISATEYSVAYHHVHVHPTRSHDMVTLHLLKNDSVVLLSRAFNTITYPSKSFSDRAAMLRPFPS